MGWDPLCTWSDWRREYLWLSRAFPQSWSLGEKWATLEDTFFHQYGHVPTNGFIFYLSTHHSYLPTHSFTHLSTYACIYW